MQAKVIFQFVFSIKHVKTPRCPFYCKTPKKIAKWRWERLFRWCATISKISSVHQWPTYKTEVLLLYRMKLWVGSSLRFFALNFWLPYESPPHMVMFTFRGIIFIWTFRSIVFSKSNIIPDIFLRNISCVPWASLAVTTLFWQAHLSHKCGLYVATRIQYWILQSLNFEVQVLNGLLF